MIGISLFFLVHHKDSNIVHVNGNNSTAHVLRRMQGNPFMVNWYISSAKLKSYSL